MSYPLYAWYSKDMVKNNTIYIYKDINGNEIETTCVSSSPEYPFKNYNISIYKDFVCLGEVTNYIRSYVTHIKTIDIVFKSFI